MFRRKEENEHDLLSDVSATGMKANNADYSKTESAETPAGNTQNVAPTGSAGYSAASSPSIRGGADNSKSLSSAYRSSATPDMARARMQAPVVSAAPAADKTGKPSRRILTVGNDILLKGEIATCDRLVIEGEVDATLNDVHTVEIAETGSFKGAAEIEDAEISGVFEGELVVRNRLVIYSTGQVHGKITYGEIEIERGGELTGEIQTIGGASAAAQARNSTKKEASAA